MTEIFYNGKFIGETENAELFVSQLKAKRRECKLPIELSIRYDKDVGMIFLTTETGRVLRPLIIAKDGQSLVTKEDLFNLSQGRMTWNDLIKEAKIEYLDAAEEEDSLIALHEDQLTSEHTHLEIDPIAMLGMVTSLVPFANHDHSSRLNRGSKTQKQALGIYSTAYPIKLDTDVSILNYPQKPIVRSFIYDSIDFYPAGQNIVVAILPYRGYNMEDAIVLNKGSVDRGLARSTYFRPYNSVELHYTGGLADEIGIPTKDVGGYKTEKSYRFLEEDGIVSPESKMESGEVLIGKTSPPKFLSDMGEISIAKARKENSVAIRQEEKGIVDAVFITIDAEGNNIVQVRTRDQRIPELGDKFSTPHGQKGVVGAIVPEADIPFTSRGVRPDLIFNPHGIPSRMTVGYLLELIAGKIGSASGKIVDGTPFAERNIADLEKQLTELGFRADGKETMYDGITGQPLEAKVYIGNMYYLKLKYMVANKIHARAAGKVTLLTRQPVEGRSKGGALRLGEMEKDALVAHGASLLLKERYDSDKVIIYCCSKCGALAIKDKLRKKEYCPACNSSEIETVEISYAFKLLIEELLAMHVWSHLILKNKFED
jgi:DNA-directed RNA polymerase subunit B'